jgi:ParB family transcriptional regulator, chromosome partitioning protein
MELEFHQLDLRYDRLRIVRPEQERRLLSSLAEVGQQVPIVAVRDGGGERFVVIDGYKRVRSLRRLGHDTVASLCWECSEAQALVMSRLWHTGESETAFEQSWLLVELHKRFQLSQEELARRFTRSVSWVSRRLALVRELPESIQERVRRGDIVAHAAEKYLVPLARANQQACFRLIEGIGSFRLSSRDMGVLYCAYRDGNAVTRQRLLEAPLLFLKTFKESLTSSPPSSRPTENLWTDIEVLGSVARRAHRRLRQGALQNLLEKEREELARSLRQSLEETRCMAERFEQELGHAGPEHANGDSQAA